MSELTKGRKYVHASIKGGACIACIPEDLSWDELDKIITTLQEEKMAKQDSRYSTLEVRND